MAALVERITFTGSQGHALAARFDRPPHEPRAIALFAHCFTCSKDIAAASRISSRLVGSGFAVLRFDFTGLGSSEGEFANTNFSSNVDDLVAAAEHLRATHGAPDLLVGHSLGGAAVLAAAARIPEVGAVATIGAPSDPVHVTGLLDDAARSAIETTGEAEVDLAGRRFTIRKQFLDDVSEQHLTEVVAGLRRPLLIMHSPIDNVVGIDHARRIFDAARHPKSFISLDVADHLLTHRDDSTFVADVLATWSARHLDLVEEEAPNVHPWPLPPEGHVVVEETHAEEHHFAQRVLAGNHALLADEPIGIGDDTGPTPYDYLLAGLGACTSMTLRMYADRKQMPLEHVRITLRHDRTHSSDCDDDAHVHADGEPCRIEQMTRTIELVGDELSDDDRARLLVIADKCPVHRTLESDPRIVTHLEPAGARGDTAQDAGAEPRD